MKKTAILITLALLLAGFSTIAHQAPVAHGAVAEKQSCKTVTKKVHGKKKKVRVCHTVKVAPKPTATATASPTAAPASFNAQVFAVPLSSYPAGSSIILSEVESNAVATANQGLLHFGPLSWDQEGRMTGYFEGLHLPFADSSGVKHTVLLAQSASVFSSHEQAVAAWNQERATWLGVPPLADLCNSTTSTTGPQWGEPAYGCADVATTTEGTAEELYFVRGRFFIQLVLGFSLSDWNIYRENVVLPTATLAEQVALQLDAIAKSA